MGILQERPDGIFYDVSVGKSAMAISMNDEAFKIFYVHQYEKEISYTKLLESVLENKIDKRMTD